MSMKIFAETPRLMIREVLLEDARSFFELDSDPEVHRYLGDAVVESIDQSRKQIASIRQEYLENGIGRWAMIEKSTHHFLGWCGLKLEKRTINHHSNFYDLGYRLIKRYWGKGYATEAAKAVLGYGFGNRNIQEIYADADKNNIASKRVLEKAGLTFVETFDDEGYAVDWYKITKIEWQNNLLNNI